MGFLDEYRKRNSIGGTTMSDKEVSFTEYEIAREFVDDPSYRKGTLSKTDLTTVDIELRAVNTDKANEKKFYILPSNVCSVGDYISFTQDSLTKTFLIEGFEYNLVSPCATVTECNSTLKLPISGKEYPCVIKNDSFGSKINSNIDFIAQVDTKLKISVQANADTLSECDLDIRFMFNKSKFDIYKISDIQTSIVSNTLTMISSKDKYLEGLDEPSLNFAFNGSKPSTTYNLSGETLIPINYEYTYTLTPTSTATFTISDSTVATIVSTTVSTVTLKPIKANSLVELKAFVNAVEVANINLTTSKF